jgi:hypothetical protein
MVMNQRECFFSQMAANPTLPCPNWEFTYWETTLPAWHQQGLPKEIDTTVKAYRHFGIEGFHFDEGFYYYYRTLMRRIAFYARRNSVSDRALTWCFTLD